ncbi:TRAP transporter permease [Brevibacillus sp. B_LB10_24]|uniref:TRAP transporter permease n=1 Tax=Brevibacillus sp. B_LB10_24 TaxID=3380645 RepID=UPI0038B731FF
MSKRQEMDSQGDTVIDEAKLEEGNVKRELGGFSRKLITAIAIFMSAFHIWVLGFYPVTPWILYTLHLGLAGVLVFFLYPMSNKGLRNTIPLWDICLALLMAAATGYFILEMDELIYRIGVAPTAWDLAASAIIVILVLEITRRTTGMILPVLAIIFILYARYGSNLPGILGHRGYNWDRILSYLTSLDAIYSVPIGASASFVFLFILFSSFLNATGASKFFIDFALGVAGGTRGGPAKTAIISSALFGSVSGNSVANVVSTGVFTIPLMKNIGYSPRFAAAVEAVSSTGGQIMPPILGSAAFIMAQLVGVSYLEIVIASIIPALLYFLTVYIMVDLEAVKLGLRGLPKSELPVVKQVLVKDGYLVIPLLVLIFVMTIMKASPIKAAIWAIASTLIVTAWKKATRMGLSRILDCLAKGAESALGMIAACATAGIIIGVLNLTGTGLKFAGLVISLSGDILPIALILTMLATSVLGMGLPTTAAYLITAAVVAPALVQMGVSTLSAHMFVFYYACLSAITPPVALAAYAGAGIAKAKPMLVGITAVKLGLVAFIVPFMFVYGPSLLWQGSIWTILTSTMTAVIGSIALGSALQGWFWGRKANALSRIILGIAAIALIKPGILSDLIGIGLIGFAFLLRYVIFSEKVDDSLSSTKF